MRKKASLIKENVQLCAALMQTSESCGTWCADGLDFECHHTTAATEEVHRLITVFDVNHFCQQTGGATHRTRQGRLGFLLQESERKKERKDVKSAMTVSDHSVFIFIPLCTWPDTLRCTEFCCCGPSSAWAACCGSRSRSWHSRPWTSCLLYGNGWSRRHCRACGRHRSGSPHVCSAGRMTKEKCVISKNEPFNYRGSVLKACVYYLMLFIGQFSRFENVGHIKKKRQYFPLKSTKL